MEDSDQIPSDLKYHYGYKTTAQYYNAMRYAAKYVIEKIGEADVAVVLGSGLG
jgi:uncharacterized protein (DUF433 family)